MSTNQEKIKFILWYYMYIIDKDHIKSVIEHADKKWKKHLTMFMKNFQEQQKIKWIKKITNDISECIFDSIIDKKISHYILGAAWVGKSTYAMNNLKGIYTDDISTLLDMIESGNSSFIVINAEKPRKEIADQAEEIIILDAPKEVISMQRKERWENNTATNFWRSEHATRWAWLSNSISKSLCANFYSEKTKIAKINNDKQRDVLPISTYNIQKITCQSIVQLAGKFSPPHLWHITMIKIKNCKDELLDVLYMGDNDDLMDDYIPTYTQIIMSGNESLQWLTHNEKIKLLQKIPWFDTVIFDHMIEFWWHHYLDCGQGKVIQVDFEHSIGILWKDRLPQWFTAWYINDEILQNFLSSHPRTANSPTAPLRNMIGKGFQYFIRADDQHDLNGIELSSSAYRQEILKDNPDYNLIGSMFDLHIAPYMIHPHNIEVIKKRLLTQSHIDQKYDDFAIQCQEKYINQYKEKYGEADFYTKPKQWENPKYKNFDLRLASKNDPKYNAKIKLIQKYKTELELQQKNMKKLYQKMTEWYKLILDDSIIKIIDTTTSE